MQRRSSGGDLRRLRSLTISTRKESEQEETLADPVAAQFDILKVLGAGSFSTVRHAIRRSDGRHFALKTISDPEKAEAARGEYEVLKRLKHPNIVQVHEFIRGSHYATLVLELVVGTNLAEAIFAFPGRHFPEGIARNLGRDLFEACDYIHTNRVLHRDIKPENVLVTSCHMHAKLVDFNAAHDMACSRPLTPTGTKLYAAPEVLWSFSSPNERSDVWSVGLCIFFMLSGRLPRLSKDLLQEDEGQEVLGADAGKSFWLEDHEVWTEISPPCKAVLRHCLALKWTERPAPMVLLRCAWLQQQAAAAKERPAGAGLEVADVDALLEVKRIACMIGKTTGFVQLSDALSDVCGGWSRQISASANSDTGFMSQESNTFSRLLSDG